MYLLLQDVIWAKRPGALYPILFPSDICMLVYSGDIMMLNINRHKEAMTSYVLTQANSD